MSDLADSTVSVTPLSGPTTDAPDWTETVSGGTGGGGGGGYASLTGPGQTASPGDLTQSGGFEQTNGVLNLYPTATSGIACTIQSNQGIAIDDTSGLTPGVHISSSSSTLLDNAGGSEVQLDAAGGCTINCFTSVGIASQSANVSLGAVNGAIDISTGGTGTTTGPPGSITLAANAGLQLTAPVVGALNTWLFVGGGNPNGVITAPVKGCLVIDVQTPGLWQATAAGAHSWQQYTFP